MTNITKIKSQISQKNHHILQQVRRQWRTRVYVDLAAKRGGSLPIALVFAFCQLHWYWPISFVFGSLPIALEFAFYQLPVVHCISICQLVLHWYFPIANYLLPIELVFAYCLLHWYLPFANYLFSIAN